MKIASFYDVFVVKHCMSSEELQFVRMSGGREEAGAQAQTARRQGGGECEQCLITAGTNLV